MNYRAATPSLWEVAVCDCQTANQDAIVHPPLAEEHNFCFDDLRTPLPLHAHTHANTP